MLPPTLDILTMTTLINKMLYRCPIYITEEKRCCETNESDEGIRDHMLAEHDILDIARRLIGLQNDLDTTNA